MNNVIVTSCGSITLQPFEADFYKGPLLPGAQLFHGTNDYGSLLVQDYHAPHYTIRHYSGWFRRKTICDMETGDAGLDMFAVLEGKLTARNKRAGKESLTMGQFTLISLTRQTIEWQVLKGTNIALFHLNISPALLDELFQVFPAINMLPTHRFSPSRYMNLQITTAINQLFDCQFMAPVRNYYFDTKIRELLLLTLLDANAQKNLVRNLSDRDIEIIYAIKKIIEKDISLHRSISELSKNFGINEFKLKIGFKHFFGAGPFAFLRNLRLQKAHSLVIHTNKPLKEIAAITGYASLSAFIGAFRKEFGMAPGTLRNN